MNSKVMNMLNNPSANLSRNGFDRGYRSIFSTKVGMELPVLCIETVPNSHYEIDPVLFMRTNAFNEANFVRMKQQVDYYFVPYSAMFRPWQEFYQQTSDPVSSVYQARANFSNIGASSLSLVPNFDLGAVVCGILKAAYSDDDYLNGLFDVADPSDTTKSSAVKSAAATWLAAHASQGMQDYSVYFLDSSQTDGIAKDIQGYSLWQSAIRLLDMLGYGNYLPLVKVDFDKIVNNPDSQSANVESNYQRIIDELKGRHVNLWRLAAYQAVCKSFHWNTTYSKPDVLSWNFDDLGIGTNALYNNLVYISSVVNSAAVTQRVRGLFQLNYRPWRYDYFTGSLPDAQFGDVAVVSSPVLSGANNSSTQGLNIAGGSPPKRVSYGSNSQYDADLTSRFTVLELRAAESLQMWREQIGRCGYKSSKRFEATFGVRPAFDPAVDIVPLGSYSADIMKDVVTGLAGDNFAEHAATGSSMLECPTIKFDTKGDFGVIIGVLSVSPIAEYDAFGVDALNTKVEPFQYYTPAFANNGLQPVFGHELSVFGNSLYGLDSVLGYVPRWAEYKQNVDRVHGEFCSQPVSLPVVGDTVPVGQFEQFVATRLDLENWIGSVRQFYVDPAVVDHIFVAAADSSQETDQFQCNYYAEVKCVQPMSELGLPRYN